MNDQDFRDLSMKQEELLIQLTTTTTNLENLCKKFDAFLDNGSPRCAMQDANIKNVKANLVAIYTWLSGISLAFLGAFFAHFFGVKG